MPTVRISIHLPYLLVLPPCEYPTPGVSGLVRLAEGSVTKANETVEARTEASALFNAPDADDAETQERQRQAEADRLLGRVNCAKQGVQLEVVKLPEAKRGFVLLPRRWVVERSFAWMTRFRRPSKDYERLSATLKAMHFVGFACILRKCLLGGNGGSA